MSAIISPCGNYRYRLEREVQPEGPVFAYFGVNPSTADDRIDDATVRKWKGFTLRNGGRKFIVGNVFAYRATDVREIGRLPVELACGPDQFQHLLSIIADADILVPCWGAADKVPPEHRRLMCALLEMLRRVGAGLGKPVLHFGMTKSGQPMHPLTLGYDTPLAPLPPPQLTNRAKQAHNAP